MFEYHIQTFHPEFSSLVLVTQENSGKYGEIQVKKKDFVWIIQIQIFRSQLFTLILVT